MKRYVVIAAVITILAGACSSSDAVVASVNGVDVLRSDVEKLVPVTDDEVSISNFNKYLAVVIQWEAISQAATADIGVTPTEDEIAERVDELVAGHGESATLDDYLEAVSASEAGIKEFAEQLIIQDAIQEWFSEVAPSIGDDVINAELESNLLDWTVVCASHILVETESEAFDVVERLEEGENFALVAEEISIDLSTSGSGGDLGCNSPAGFVDSFSSAVMSAEIDVVTEPVESEFGYHIILVSQRETATQDVVRDILIRDVLVSDVERWFSDAIESAEVVVDEEFGVWVTDPSPQILSVN